MKAFADKKLNDAQMNGRNTVGNGEIALNQYISFFYIFPQSLKYESYHWTEKFYLKFFISSLDKYKILTEPHSLVADFRIEGRWFEPWLCQYSFRGLMVVIATGFIPLSLLSVVSTIVMWESSQWLVKNTVPSTG